MATTPRASLLREAKSRRPRLILLPRGTRAGPGSLWPVSSFLVPPCPPPSRPSCGPLPSSPGRPLQLLRPGFASLLALEAKDQGPHVGSWAQHAAVPPLTLPLHSNLIRHQSSPARSQGCDHGLGHRGWFEVPAQALPCMNLDTSSPLSWKEGTMPILLVRKRRLKEA